MSWVFHGIAASHHLAHHVADSHDLAHRVVAILAGGIVLGVGTISTMATWNDSEHTKGTFTAGTFNMQGSNDGSTGWDDHPVSAPNTLSFSTAYNNLQPDSVTYAGYAVRLAENTSLDAAVAITAGSSGTVTGLTYQLAKVAGSTCSDTTIGAGTVLVPSGTAVGAVAGTAAFDLAKGSPTTSAGATVYLCFKVTAGAITQAQSGTGTWQFLATSKTS